MHKNVCISQVTYKAVVGNHYSLSSIFASGVQIYVTAFKYQRR